MSKKKKSKKRPAYYKSHGIEVWDIWDAFDLDRYQATAAAYVIRAGKKRGESYIKDMTKAVKTIKRGIKNAKR